MYNKSTVQVTKNHAYDKYHDTFNFTVTDRVNNNCCMVFVAYNDQLYMHTWGLFNNSVSIICEFYVKHFIFNFEAAFAVATFGRSSKPREMRNWLIMHNANARAELILQYFLNLCQDGTDAPGAQI